MKIDVVLSEGLAGSCSPDVLGALVIVSPPDPLSPLASSWFLLAAFWDFTSDFAELFHCFITTTPRPNPLRLGWGVVRRLVFRILLFLPWTRLPVLAPRWGGASRPNPIGKDAWTRMVGWCYPARLALSCHWIHMYNIYNTIQGFTNYVQV